jgi:hypothetical protein
VRSVHARLTRGHAFARHDDGLHAFQEFVVVVDARGGRDDDASASALSTATIDQVADAVAGTSTSSNAATKRKMRAMGDYTHLNKT